MTQGFRESKRLAIKAVCDDYTAALWAAEKIYREALDVARTEYDRAIAEIEAWSSISSTPEGKP